MLLPRFSIAAKRQVGLHSHSHLRPAITSLIGSRVATSALPYEKRNIFDAIRSLLRTSKHLRPYQEEAIQAVTDHLGCGLNRFGISLPTGSGKTFVLASLLGRLESRGMKGQVLIVVPSADLVKQTRNELRAVLGLDILVGIEAGGAKCTGKENFIIGTYQSLRRAKSLSKLDAHRFKLVVADEAHHSRAKSYLEIFSHFNRDVARATYGSQPVHATLPRVPIVGFTATWERGDGKSLGSVYEDIVYNIGPKELIDEGILSRVKVVAANAEAEGYPHTIWLKGKVEKRFIESDVVNEAAIELWKTLAHDRKSTIVFCANKKHAKMVAAKFVKYGFDTRVITDATQVHHRDTILDDFKEGRFPVLINVQVLTEGIDVPRVDCVSILRPVKSRTWVKQMMGRGMRVFRGKKDCLVLDPFGVTRRMRLWDEYGLHGSSIAHTAVNGHPYLTGAMEETSTPNVRGRLEGIFHQVLGQDIQIDDEPFKRTPQNQTILALPRHSVNAWVITARNAFVLDVFSRGHVEVSQASDSADWLVQWVPSGLTRMQQVEVTELGRTSQLHHAYQIGDRYVREHFANYHGLSRNTEWMLREANGSLKEEVVRVYKQRLDKRPKRGCIVLHGRAVPLDGITQGEARSLITAMQFSAEVRLVTRR